jgi:hypothetical protein
MVNMTMAIPEQLSRVMKKHSEIKWTHVAREAIEKKAKELDAKKDAWREYALKHALENWDDADELIKY